MDPTDGGAPTRASPHSFRGAGGGWRSRWIDLRGGGVVVPVIPIGHPLKDVPQHIRDAIGAVSSRKSTNRLDLWVIEVAAPRRPRGPRLKTPPVGTTVLPAGGF